MKILIVNERKELDFRGDNGDIVEGKKRVYEDEGFWRN